MKKKIIILQGKNIKVAFGMERSGSYRTMLLYILSICIYKKWIGLIGSLFLNHVLLHFLRKLLSYSGMSVLFTYSLKPTVFRKF